MTNTDRLAELATKQTLTEVEDLELRDLMLQRNSLKIVRQRSSLAAARRKAEDRQKYALGALVVDANLSAVDEATLRGALSVIAEHITKDDPQWRNYWKSLGEKIIADKKAR